MEQAFSRYEVIGEESITETELAMIEVDIADAAAYSEHHRLLPAKVVITASDGSHPDGFGFGVYSDGRFFTEGHFCVSIPAGKTGIDVYCGPNYVPLQIAVDVPAGKKLQIRALLHRWFSPEERGWYGGDNHVHSQHDRTPMKKTGLAYTALQGRANGLSYITESGSNNVSYENIDQWNTDGFLLQYAPELGGVCFMGHLITPGITHPIPREQYARITKRPLAGQAVKDAVHELDGVVVYTHPLTPAYQLHWMGATQLYSDAVLGQCADAFDIETRATELLWFSALNLGNKLACSSYTDSTLERLHTLTPGDRRVYSYAEELQYRNVVEAIRLGRTFATNGGPVFVFFTIDGHKLGDSMISSEGKTYTANVEIHSLHPLKKVEFYRRGNVVQSFDVAGRNGEQHLSYSFQETEQSWYVIRAEDEKGNWCITSPIYFEPKHVAPRPSATALLFEISNHNRLIHLRKDFFAHVLVTASPDDPIAEVQFIKDNKAVQLYSPHIGSDMVSGKIPVTEAELGCDYSLGWIWYPESSPKVHFQLDYPIKESGWYSVSMTTESGQTHASDAVYFDNRQSKSHVLTTVKLSGGDTSFRLWGYGEEMPLEDIREPYEDRWWYESNTYWRVKADFSEQTWEQTGGNGNEENIRNKFKCI